MPTDRTLGRTRQLRHLITGIASGVALTSVLPAVSAQEYELVPPSQDATAERGITIRAQVDVMFTPPGAGAPPQALRAPQRGCTRQSPAAR